MNTEYFGFVSPDLSKVSRTLLSPLAVLDLHYSGFESPDLGGHFFLIQVFNCLQSEAKNYDILQMK